MNPEPLPAFKVFLSDGDHYITSMAHGTTIHAARRYLMGMIRVTEDGDGNEISTRVIRVEPMNPESQSRALVRRLVGNVWA